MRSAGHRTSIASGQQHVLYNVDLQVWLLVSLVPPLGPNQMFCSRQVIKKFVGTFRTILSFKLPCVQCMWLHFVNYYYFLNFFPVVSRCNRWKVFIVIVVALYCEMKPLIVNTVINSAEQKKHHIVYFNDWKPLCSFLCSYFQEWRWKSLHIKISLPAQLVWHLY